MEWYWCRAHVRVCAGAMEALDWLRARLETVERDLTATFRDSTRLSKDSTPQVWSLPSL